MIQNLVGANNISLIPMLIARGMAACLDISGSCHLSLLFCNNTECPSQNLGGEQSFNPAVCCLGNVPGLA